MGQRAAIYCRVSTADQSCERQERDLAAFADRAGYEVVATFKETGSGAKLDRTERRKIMALAQSRQIDAILVTELSRWGRSTIDLLNTLRELEGWKVSIITMSGMAFDLSSPHGRMLATFLSGIAEFERDLISERVKSGLAAAKARGRRLGRQIGERPKSDRLAPKVVALIAEGRSYRWIARDLGISKIPLLRSPSDTDALRTTQLNRHQIQTSFSAVRSPPACPVLRTPLGSISMS
ncbi:recombinase family protein [Ochrobactrum daejeonense]|nr:recombinase family protein [Brucella daejeonensis]